MSGTERIADSLEHPRCAVASQNRFLHVHPGLVQLAICAILVPPSAMLPSQEFLNMSAFESFIAPYEDFIMGSNPWYILVPYVP